MRKSKKQRENKKLINTAYKELNKKFEKDKYNISVNNLVLAFFNMFTTEFIRYTGKDRRDLMPNTLNTSKRIDEVKKHYKNDSLFSLNLDYYYKGIFAYLKGANERIGHINNFKDHNAILNFAEIEFEASRKELQEKGGDETIYQFIIGDEASSLLGHLTYSVVTLERLIDKSTFEKSVKRYLKTTLTKVTKMKQQIEKDLFDLQNYYISNNKYLKRHDQISYILFFQCKLAGIEATKQYKKFWGNIANEYSKESDEVLELYFEDTVNLLEKYKKTKFIKKVS